MEEVDAKVSRFLCVIDTFHTVLDVVVSVLCEIGRGEIKRESRMSAPKNATVVGFRDADLRHHQSPSLRRVPSAKAAKTPSRQSQQPSDTVEDAFLKP